MKREAIILASAIALGAAWAAWGAPPEGVDLQGATHQWFEAQHSIGGAWCCNVADGHVLADDEWRITADHYEVLIAGHWYRIEPDKVRDPKGGPNPTGHAILWYGASDYGVVIWCFAPGTAT